VLGAEQQKQLSSYIQLNGTALQSRTEGVNQLRQAELSLQRGNNQDALAFLRAVTPNQQFLTAADKQKMQLLNERLLPVDGDGLQTRTTGSSLARTKLRQARGLLKQGRYDAAQSLAS